MILKTLKWSLLVVLTVITLFVVNLIWFKPFSINHYFERVFLEFALDSPEMLSQIRMLEPMGIKYHQDDLDDASMASQQQGFEDLKQEIITLESYDDADLTESQQLSKAILLFFLNDMAEGERWQFHNYPLNQLFGVQSGFPSFMESAHQITELRDAEDYVARLSKVDEKFAQIGEGLKHRESLGIIPPTFVIDKVLAEMQGFIDTPVEENILYSSLQEKMAEVDEISPEQRDEILAQAKAVFESDVRPAYQGFIDYYTALRPKSTNDDGVWKLPDGDEFYAYMLRHHTTTDMDAATIHDIGVAEVARIQAQMLGILEAEGYKVSEGFTVAMAELAEDDRFYYEDSDAGRQQILDDYTTMIAEIDTGLGDWFAVKPKAPVEVKRIPLFKEKTSPGAYYNGPSMDGSKPGIFYANLYDIKATPKYGMRTLAYHEAVPGHHFQIGIQRELEGLPTFRTMLPFTVYSEGWALYSEQLAWEAGFQQNPLDNLGRLQAELFRAVRLVVDTGLHYKRWTREEAIDYMAANTGMAMSDVVVEIERYIVMPGQATAYKTGMLKLIELRQKAQEQLADKFDIKAFHDVVLKNGAMPLAILEQQVDAYIAGAQ
ncbi:DUF885 domain-containing protein [Shewanella submarina]|uniref:DUF885 domain-containing protein n=1 Tax=Shewanella submarina TaxID=2016376 RepID=A0ABV7GAV8_9GAMM|nr:DUF885 domain-containing protein [Shewanella submarina]MCL1037173.1 DUF885 domain-containing protein [Shewanella submarina]